MKVKFVLLSVLVVMAIAVVLPATASAGKTGAAVVYDATLAKTNAVDVYGSAHFVLIQRGGKLIVQLRVYNNRGSGPRTVAITGFTDGSAAKLPNPGTDTNHDGMISGAEVALAVGQPLVWLEPIRVKRNRMIVFQTTLRQADLAALDPVNIMLGKCAIVVYGVLLEPAYAMPFFDATAPAACGLITAKKIK